MSALGTGGYGGAMSQHNVWNGTGMSNNGQTYKGLVPGGAPGAGQAGGSQQAYPGGQGGGYSPQAQSNPYQAQATGDPFATPDKLDLQARQAAFTQNGPNSAQQATAQANYQSQQAMANPGQADFQNYANQNYGQSGQSMTTPDQLASLRGNFQGNGGLPNNFSADGKYNMTPTSSGAAIQNYGGTPQPFTNTSHAAAPPAADNHTASPMAGPTGPWNTNMSPWQAAHQSQMSQYRASPLAAQQQARVAAMQAPGYQPPTLGGAPPTFKTGSPAASAQSAQQRYMQWWKQNNMGR